MAAYGWDHPWPGLYPDDLPPEWRLDYYSNQFRALLVPYRDWSGADDAQWQVWAEELPAGFRLFWELPGSDLATLTRLEQHCSELRGRCGGIVLVGEGTPAVLPTQLPWVHFAGAPGSYRGEGMGLLWLESCPPLRQLREEFEALLTGQPAAASVLVVISGAIPDSHCLEQATILADMLG